MLFACTRVYRYRMNHLVWEHPGWLGLFNLAMLIDNQFLPYNNINLSKNLYGPYRLIAITDYKIPIFKIAKAYYYTLIVRKTPLSWCTSSLH